MTLLKSRPRVTAVTSSNRRRPPPSDGRAAEETTHRDPRVFLPSPRRGPGWGWIFEVGRGSAPIYSLSRPESIVNAQAARSAEPPPPARPGPPPTSRGRDGPNRSSTLG